MGFLGKKLPAATNAPATAKRATATQSSLVTTKRKNSSKPKGEQAPAKEADVEQAGGAYKPPPPLSTKSLKSAMFTRPILSPTLTADVEDEDGSLSSGEEDTAYDTTCDTATYTIETKEGKAYDDACTFLHNGGSVPNPEPLVMASLLQWKQTSENGPWMLRFLLVSGSIGMMVTSVLQFYFDVDDINVRSIVIAVYTFTIGIVEIVLDSRFALAQSPVGCRAKMRGTITSYFNVLRLLWGRGAMCVVAGTLHIAQMSLMSIASGTFLCVIGACAIILGAQASRSLEMLKSSITDEDFLWLEFSKQDGDQDSCLDPNEFAIFISNIGLDFDDLYTLKAFNSIHKRSRSLVSFHEFKRWWSQCTFKSGNIEETQMYLKF